MLERIRLRNFQCHRDSVLDLVPGINVITGQSDQGKSSVLRSISWALLGRPKGSGFRNHDAGEKEPTSVLLRFDDTTILKKRVGPTTSYKLDGEVLTALAGAVPRAVADKARIPEDSIQRQGDAPFLISMAPGEAARLLNQVAGFDIDDVFRRLAKLTYSAQEALSDATAKSGALAQELAAQPDLQILERLTNRALRCSEKIEEKTKRKDGLSAAIHNYQVAARSLKVQERRLESVATLLEVASAMSKRTRNGQSKLADLKTWIRHYCDSKAKLNSLDVPQNVLEQLENASKLHTRAQATAAKLRSLRSLLKDYRAAKEGVVAADAQRLLAISRRDRLIAELGVCPLCGASKEAMCSSH